MTCGNCGFFNNGLCYAEPPKIIEIDKQNSFGQLYREPDYLRPEVARVDIACRYWRKHV